MSRRKILYHTPIPLPAHERMVRQAMRLWRSRKYDEMTSGHAMALAWDRERRTYLPSGPRAA